MADTQQSGSPSSPQGGSNKDSGQKLSWGQSNTSKPASTANQLPPGSGNSSRMVGTFVAGLIIGLLLAWAWFDLRGGMNNGASSMASSTDQFTVTQTGGSAESSSSNISAGAQGSGQSANASVA